MKRLLFCGRSIWIGVYVRYDGCIEKGVVDFVKRIRGGLWDSYI